MIRKVQESNLKQLKRVYPRLASVMERCPNTLAVDTFVGMMPIEIINDAVSECERGLELHDDLIYHFANIAEIAFDDDTLIGIGCLEPVTIKDKVYYIIGDYNKYSDGDKLAVLPDGPQIYYLSHENNEIEPLCDNIEELFEVEFASGLQECSR